MPNYQAGIFTFQNVYVNTTQTELFFKVNCLFLVNELRDVVVPALAESLSEGDIRWIKGIQFYKIKVYINNNFYI